MATHQFFLNKGTRPPRNQCSGLLQKHRAERSPRSPTERCCDHPPKPAEAKQEPEELGQALVQLEQPPLPAAGKTGIYGSPAGTCSRSGALSTSSQGGLMAAGSGADTSLPLLGCLRVLLSPYLQFWSKPVSCSFLFSNFDACVYREREGAISAPTRSKAGEQSAAVGVIKNTTTTPNTQNHSVTVTSLSWRSGRGHLPTAPTRGVGE